MYPHVDGSIICYGSCGGTTIKDDYTLIYHIQDHIDKKEDIPTWLLGEILSDKERYEPYTPREI